MNSTNEVLADFNRASAIIEDIFRLEAGIDVGPDVIFFNELHRLASHERLRERFADRIKAPEEPAGLRLVGGGK